jgi:hypothetical protein
MAFKEIVPEDALAVYDEKPLNMTIGVDAAVGPDCTVISWHAPDGSVHHCRVPPHVFSSGVLIVMMEKRCQPKQRPTTSSRERRFLT